MKIVQKIWSELSAQPQKVELAVSDKLVYAKGVRTFGKNIDIDIKELETANRSLSVDVDDLRQDMKVLSKGVSEVESAAKELGVNLPGKALREQAKEWLKDSNKFFNSLKKNL